jgi:DNA-binding MarR family transcriptional regulator
MEGVKQMSEYITNGFLIKQIHDRLEKQANNTLRGKDLTMMQISVLMELQEAEQKQRSMKELERKFCVAQSTVAGIISRLEQKGFVEAFGDPSDKRIKLVHITPDGEACCREAAGYMAEAEQMLLHGFSEDEKAIFNQLLARAAENMK